MSPCSLLRHSVPWPFRKRHFGEGQWLVFRSSSQFSEWPCQLLSRAGWKGGCADRQPQTPTPRAWGWGTGSLASFALVLKAQPPLHALRSPLSSTSLRAADRSIILAGPRESQGIKGGGGHSPQALSHLWNAESLRACLLAHRDPPHIPAPPTCHWWPQFSSVAQSCPTLCDPMDCCTV